tara:strand:- start:1664 stop:2041 length:378 start_codon:yes stop_codon:yes gene_type:complete
MKKLIIDAASEKILLCIITKKQSYTTTHLNSRENFDKFMKLISNFLRDKKININEISKIFVNQGPGKFSSIRNSIAIAKAISLSKNIDLYGFKTEQLELDNYKKIVEMDLKKLSINNLIKPLYSS